MVIQKHKYNKSTYFILPLTKIPFYEFNQGNDVLINTYINCEYFKKEFNTLSNIIYVVLDNTVADYDAFSQLLRSRYTKGIWLDKHNDRLIIPIIIDGAYSLDITWFLEGKYSRFHSGTKQVIEGYIKKTFVDENTGKVVDNINYRALFPNEETRKSLSILLDAHIDDDAEVLSPPYITDETLHVNPSVLKCITISN